MQSYLRYRRFGSELKALQERDHEQFHRQHSHSLQDRASLHKTLHSGHSHHAARGDQLYLGFISHLRSHESSEHAPSGGEHASPRFEVVGGLDSVLDGVEVQEQPGKEGHGDNKVFVVHFTQDDPDDPHNWSILHRLLCVLQVASIGFLALFSSAVDAPVAPQAAKALGVSEVVEPLATDMWLIGSGMGSMVVRPFSETFGRNPVYIVSTFFFMVFNMAAALSPNIAAQIIFRFFVGIFAALPLVCGGGSISDLFNPLERTWAFPLYAIIGFGGPMLGPVLCSYLYTWHWRWVYWTTLIMGGLVFIVTALFLPETHPAIIQAWKAQQLRHVTSDDRYRAPSELTEVTFWHRVSHALTRPFVLGPEPIVIAISIYLSIIWSVLFIFLDGYPSIFQETYGISQGLTNVIFVAMYIGVLCAIPFTAFVYHLTSKDMASGHSTDGDGKIRSETRQYFAIAGVSIWSSIISTAFFGFGLITIFFSAYLYVIDAYEVNAASALAFTTVTRYVISGGVTVGGVPFFEDVDHCWVLTILGIISLLFGATVPYLLYWYGPALRKRSTNAVNKS